MRKALRYHTKRVSLSVVVLLTLRQQIQTPIFSLTEGISHIELELQRTGEAKHLALSGSNNINTTSTTTSEYTVTEKHETAKYEKSIQALRNSTLKYYVYDHWQITREKDSPSIRVDEETYVFNAFLRSHTLWRVTDPDLADLFIVPAPIVSHVYWSRDIRRIMLRLLRHPIFIKTQGNRHVIFALEGRYFDVGNATMSPVIRQFNEKWAPCLFNATIAMNHDLLACQKLHEDSHDHGDWNEYFDTVKPRLRHTFSIGLVAGSSLPVIPASYERFQTMKYTVFYHTRTAPSVYGSTPYRRAPINVTLPYKATIGYDLPPDEWIQRFTSSKFCLVIRGDTPNSHALLRAVKVGCIPVVVCDYYPIFAPTFKTSLDIRDFSIFLDEKAFLENPQQQLSLLADIPEVVIRKKLVALQYAQQVTCPDHPDSLFIPALLREADVSFLPSYEH